MYAVVNHLQFNKPVDEFKDIVQNDGIPILSKHNGFIDFHFIKVDQHSAIVLIFWEDAASAMAGAKSFGPTWFAANFNHFLLEQRAGALEKLLQALSGSKVKCIPNRRDSLQSHR